MELTAAAAKVVLANTFVMYFKAHSYHWNVEGRTFAQDHEFLGDLYEELHAAIDPTAEQIRACAEYAPFSMEDLFSAKTITEDTAKPRNAEQMFGNLLSANEQVIESLNKLFEVAETANKQGLVDFVAGRLDVHAKHGWMLRSLMKSGE
jgi:starvation-inducible DNA-binding protein